MNDCWTHSHSQEQRWYWNSALNSSQGEVTLNIWGKMNTFSIVAVIFDTFRSPHTSASLPCESLIRHLLHVSVWIFNFLCIFYDFRLQLLRSHLMNCSHGCRETFSFPSLSPKERAKVLTLFSHFHSSS